MGGDAADPDLVERGADGAGDMRAMATLVDVRRVLAGLVRILLAGTVDHRVVDGEVAAELAVEVRCDIGVIRLDPGVDDAHEHVMRALLIAVRAGEVGVDHGHVPLDGGERVHGWVQRRAHRPRPAGVRVSVEVGQVSLEAVGRRTSDGAVGRDTVDRAGAGYRGAEVTGLRADRRESDSVVLAYHSAAGLANRGARARSSSVS